MRCLFSIIVLCSTAFVSAQGPKIKSGRWQGKLKITSSQDLPFVFLLKQGKEKTTVTFKNAEEQIKLDNISFLDDSIFIPFTAFDSEFRGRVNDKKHITGFWYNHAKKGNYHLPFSAIFGKKPRFTAKPSVINVSGRWEVTFSYDDNPYSAIGIFDQDKDNVVTGTFRTETGDYRFLEGVVSADSLYLSTFDGAHAFLFLSSIKEDSLNGVFYSGNHYKTNWIAKRNEHFRLSDPDSLTYLVNKKPIDFSLPDLDSNTVHFSNETNNKVTLIQIMGSWCPNCMDESIYLRGLSNKYKDSLRIVAVAFETPASFASKSERLKKYSSSLNLNYTFLIGGNASKTCASEVFPMINEIISFPTLIIIDKKGVVRKIHTGFNGPGTGQYYDQFAKETEEFVHSLIQE